MDDGNSAESAQFVGVAPVRDNVRAARIKQAQLSSGPPTRAFDVSKAQDKSAMLYVWRIQRGGETKLMWVGASDVTRLTTDPESFWSEIGAVDPARVFSALTELQADQERFDARKREARGLDSAPLTGKISISPKLQAKVLVERSRVPAETPVVVGGEGAVKGLVSWIEAKVEHLLKNI